MTRRFQRQTRRINPTGVNLFSCRRIKVVLSRFPRNCPWWIFSRCPRLEGHTGSVPWQHCFSLSILIPSAVRLAISQFIYCIPSRGWFLIVHTISRDGWPAYVAEEYHWMIRMILVMSVSRCHIDVLFCARPGRTKRRSRVYRVLQLAEISEIQPYL